MGTNLHIERVGGEQHPDWNSDWHAGDNEFLGWQAGSPWHTPPNYRLFTDNRLLRPGDFDAARAAIPTDAPNPERWQHLLNILEQDDGWWLFEDF